jgi:acetyltransferase EpsM
MKKYIFIIGGKSIALEIRETIDQYYQNQYSEIYNVIGDAEGYCAKNSLRDEELITFISQHHQDMEIYYIIGLTDFKLKHKYVSFFKDYKGNPINIIHPSSYISPSVKLGSGNYIAANAVLSTNAIIGNHNIVNYNVTIGHDTIIGSNCVFNPGARISGNVQIADDVLIGANSFIFQGKNIGKDVLIDAMTYIDRDIPNNSLCSSKQVKVFKRRF